MSEKYNLDEMMREIEDEGKVEGAKDKKLSQDEIKNMLANRRRQRKKRKNEDS